MDVTSLISVIVPIYNVEKYVRKCLESLKNQTMREIEIICIDDGSTDRSGMIADEYAKADERFRVIHSENRGLSAARNRGIDESRSDWLMFVDSDDWVVEKFCEIPWKARQRYNADLVIFGSVIDKNGKTIICQREKKRPHGVIEEFLAHEYGEIVVWNKLYKRDLFNDVRYPERRFAEDVATTHKLVHKADKIVLLSSRLYHYVYRPDSISHNNNVAIRIDGFLSNYERYEDLVRYGYPEGKVIGTLCAAAIGILARLAPDNDDVCVRAKTIIDSIKSIPRGLTWKQKVGFVAWKTNVRLFYLLSFIAGRRK